jgi:hypothetical protein
LEPSQPDRLHNTLDALLHSFKQSLTNLGIFMIDAQKGLEQQREMARDIVTKLEGATAGKSKRGRTPKGSVRVKFNEKEMQVLRDVMSSWTQAGKHYPALLAEMAFIYLLAIFDAFMTDVFLAVLTARPEMMRSSKKQLAYETILAFSDTKDLTAYMAQRELNEIGYKELSDQLSYYKERFGIDVLGSGIALDDLQRIRMNRNLLVHNNGKVNAIYVKTVANSGYKLGDRILVSPQNWRDARQVLQKIAVFVHIRLLKKFGGLKES